MEFNDKKAVYLPESWKTAIRSYIEDNGIKYVFFARKIGTGKTQVSQILAGVRKINRYEHDKILKLIPTLEKIILPELEPEPQE